MPLVFKLCALGVAIAFQVGSLDLAARIPGISKEAFDSAAASAKANCPVSRLLKAEITLSASLEQAA